MDSTLFDATGLRWGGPTKTIRFEDEDESHYRVTVDSWNSHITLTISKDEGKWIVEASEQEGKICK